MLNIHKLKRRFPLTAFFISVYLKTLLLLGGVASFFLTANLLLPEDHFLRDLPEESLVVWMLWTALNWLFVEHFFAIALILMAAPTIMAGLNRRVFPEGYQANSESWDTVITAAALTGLGILVISLVGVPLVAAMVTVVEAFMIGRSEPLLLFATFVASGMTLGDYFRRLIRRKLFRTNGQEAS